MTASSTTKAAAAAAAATAAAPPASVPSAATPLVIGAPTVPPHAVECFKAVAVVNGRMLSIFDGNTEYALNRVCHLPHSGLWVCPSIFSLLVHAAKLPSHSGA